MRVRAALIAAFAALALATPAEADTFTVTNGSSDVAGSCDKQTCTTLRAAITAAKTTLREADFIYVPAGTINLGSDLLVDTDVTILGVSARTNILDGGDKHRGLRVPAGATVALQHYTIRRGAAGEAGSNDGGGVLNAGALTLDNVHITTSLAARGGGVANLSGGGTTIQHSLIDGNTATGTGGGVANIGSVETQPLTVISMTDSTVFANTGKDGAGGIAAVNNGGLIGLARTTIADNIGSSGAGGILTTVTARTIVYGSIATRNRIGAATSNCGLTKPTNNGANVEDNDTCGFGPTADPVLATKLSSAGGETDVLAIAAGSAAIDRLAVGDNCEAGTLDQRGLRRPQGSACDSGAYEFDVPATYTITGGPTGTISSDAAQIDFSSSDPSATPACQLTGPGQAGGYGPCYKSNAALYTNLPNGAFTFSVRDADFPSSTPATRSFTVAALDSTITDGPNGPTNDTTPTFAFTGANGAVGFQCRVDGATFAACTTPATTLTLTEGAHTFEVRALNAQGQAENTPASRSFTVDITPPNTTITDGPTGNVASTTASNDATPTFSFASEPGAVFECRLDGPAGALGAFGACTSPKGFNALAPGDYVFFVRSTDSAGNSQTTQRAFTVTAPQHATPTPTPTPPPAPTPVANQTVNAQPVSGTVLVKVNGRFVPLVPSLIRNGTEVDARKGVVQITTAQGEVARFYDGVFKITQAGGLTTLTLTEKLTGCPKARRSTASAAAKKPKTRKLWGDGKGRFKTKGQYSAATVRGTKWLVQDSCTTTLTRVVQGVVEVEDFAKKKQVLVKQGKRYSARAKKR
jgi:hypothetical protein